MNRKCGGCTTCCKLLPVRELAKGAGERCRHQSSKGCAVYHKPGFPPSCAVWNCRWLLEEETAALRRPDRAHYVLDVMPDLVRATDKATGEMVEVPVIQVWVDPAYPDAWRDPALLAYAAAQGDPLLIRYDSRRAFLVTQNSAGEMMVHDDSKMVASPSGSLLLDKMGAS